MMTIAVGDYSTTQTRDKKKTKVAVNPEPCRSTQSNQPSQVKQNTTIYSSWLGPLPLLPVFLGSRSGTRISNRTATSPE